MNKTMDLKKNYYWEGENSDAIRGIDMQIEGGEYNVMIIKSGGAKSTSPNLPGVFDLPTAVTIHKITNRWIYSGINSLCVLQQDFSLRCC